MSKVLDIKDGDLTPLLKEADKLIFVDFWAEWCGPCKMVGPVVEELATEYENITFTKVNVDENPESTALYAVRSIPTFVVIKNNEVVYRHVGAAPKSFFVQKLKSLME